MDDTSRIEAQLRADEIRIFRKELERLEREGVLMLADAQRAAVNSHHEGLLARFAQSFDIDRDMRSKQMSWGMRIASFLGALALAASVFFLFYQFWGRFTETAQVAILIGASLGMFAVTAWIQGRDASGYFTKLAAMVAFACFVLNVAMLGQIFNITPSDKALLPWAALAFLLAYACDLRLLLAAGIICIIVYTAARFGTWSGMYWIYFGERPENFFPVSLLLFFLPQLVPHRQREDFAPIYRVFAILAMLLPVLILSNWGDISYLTWPVTRIEHFYQIIGFVLSAALVWLGLRKQWGEVVNTGVTFFVIFLYTKFYDWWWELFPKYLFFLVVGLTAVLFLFIIKRLRHAAQKLPAQKPPTQKQGGRMKNWTRKHTLIAGLALILLTNAVALLGVYRNRSGEPESMLTLTQRELQQPYGWGMTRENSGVSLRINWRVPSAEKSWNYAYSGGNPVWLDQAKMASLGFDVSPSKDTQDNFRWSSRQLAREVLLVLELDGPAYQQALQQAQQFAAEQDAKLAALPDDRAMQQSAKSAHEEARREEQENSRLFAVDAGLDLNELRAQYPDRNRYAIVRAQVRPWSIGGQGKIAGYIDKISIDEINVPHEYHTAFDIRVRPAIIGQTSGRRTFEASVAFGKRLEPWLVGISTGE